MKKYLLLFIPLLAACGHSTTPPQSGTFTAHTITQAGPGVYDVSATVYLKDTNGVTVQQFMTDSSGNATLPLAPGSYKWGQLHPSPMVPDRVIIIQPSAITYDTLNFCPWCV